MDTDGRFYGLPSAASIGDWGDYMKGVEDFKAKVQAAGPEALKELEARATRIATLEQEVATLKIKLGFLKQLFYELRGHSED